MLDLRMVEYVGQHGLFSNPVVEYNLAHGLYSPSELKVLRLAARKRIYRVNHKTIRILTPTSPEGLSKFLQWGPEEDSFVIPVSSSDARIIFSEPTLKGQFLDVTNLEPIGPAGSERFFTVVAPDGRSPVARWERTEELDTISQLTRALNTRA